MAEYEKRVRIILKQNGCRFLRHGKGDHDVWQNPASGRQAPVPVEIKSRHTANAIFKQLGIAYKF